MVRAQGNPGGPSPWLAWFQRLRAVAQTGMAYARDPYDQERYQEISTLAEQMLGMLLDVPPQRIGGIYLSERGYPTPKVDVRAGVFRDGQVLLVRETSDGRWSLPGGWADEQQSPRQCVEREVREESGFLVCAASLVAVRDRSLHPYEPPRLEHVYKLLFLCELVGGSATPGLETSKVGFFHPDQLPELSRGRTLEADIRQLARHLRRPELPPTFD